VIPSFPVYLFDIDGTLLNSAPDICGAVGEVLREAGCAGFGDEFLRGYVGLGLEDLFTDVFPGCGEDQMTALIERYRVFYHARAHEATTVYPGVRETLEELGGLKGTATTKRTAGTRAVLERFGLARYFDHIQGTDGIPCKPAPDVLLAAMASLGACPEDCLMVGDSQADIEAGRRAGMKTCVVEYGYGNRTEIEKLRPDYRVSDLRELLGG
jgi:2-phosphoglycolate phosphatase